MIFKTRFNNAKHLPGNTEHVGLHLSLDHSKECVGTPVVYVTEPPLLSLSCLFLYFILDSTDRSKGRLRASKAAAPHLVALQQLESSFLPGIYTLVDRLSTLNSLGLK